MKYFLLMMIALSASAAPALEGQERGGGRQAELEFAEFGRLSAKAIEQSLGRGDAIFQGFNLAAFRAALEATEIQAREHLCSNHVDVNTGATYMTCLDAQYLPEFKRIELSEKEWRKKRCLDRAALALHEYGRASGNEDGNYRFSSRVKESDQFQAACDGWEGDQSERCMSRLNELDLSLKKLLKRYEATKKKFSESYAKNVFMEGLKVTMVNWSSLGSTKECRLHAEEACVDACTPIEGRYCVAYCQVGREEYRL